MSQELRERLIDAYYAAVDEEEFDVFERIMTADAVHVRPGQGVLEGGAAVRAYYETERTATDTTHAVRERFHGGSTSVCILVVTGETPSGSFARPVVSEFTFDSDEENIAAYRVYRGSTNDPRVTE